MIRKQQELVKYHLPRVLHEVDKTLLALMMLARYKQPEITARELATLAGGGAQDISKQILEMAQQESRSGLEILDGRNQEKIVAIMPLPPHITDWFDLNHLHVTYIQVDHHPIPPHFKMLEVITSLKDAVMSIKNAGYFALEGYREASGQYLIPSSVAYTVLPHIPDTAKILLHIRPHPHVTDEKVFISHTIIEI